MPLHFAALVVSSVDDSYKPQYVMDMGKIHCAPASSLELPHLIHVLTMVVENLGMRILKSVIDSKNIFRTKYT